MTQVGAAVTLTDDEIEECEAFIRSLVRDSDGEWVVKKEYADLTQRGMIALCLMSRAERFLGQAGGSAIHIVHHKPYYSPGLQLDEDLADRACVSAAKACAILPLPIYSYDFGCILYQVGKFDEARIAFAAFLSAIEHSVANPAMDMWNKTRDIAASASIARELLGQAQGSDLEL